MCIRLLQHPTSNSYSCVFIYIYIYIQYYDIICRLCCIGSARGLYNEVKHTALVGHVIGHFGTTEKSLNESSLTHQTLEGMWHDLYDKDLTQTS